MLTIEVIEEEEGVVVDFHHSYSSTVNDFIVHTEGDNRKPGKFHSQIPMTICFTSLETGLRYKGPGQIIVIYHKHGKTPK